MLFPVPSDSPILSVHVLLRKAVIYSTGHGTKEEVLKTLCENVGPTLLPPWECPIMLKALYSQMSLLLPKLTFHIQIITPLHGIG